MKKIVPFLLAIIVLFSSCSAIETLSLQDETRAPGWIRNPRVVYGRIAYIAEGEGDSEDEARLNAIENVLLELERDLGRDDIYQRYFRELGTNGSIVDFDGNIRQSYVRASRDGRYTYYLWLDISQERFISMRDPMITEALEVDQRINSMLSDAREEYMANRDISALSKTLDALLLALENNSPLKDEVLERALYYLSALEIVVDRRVGEMNADISLRRRRGLLSPYVYDAPLKASYSIREVNGNIQTETISFTTGEGRYEYRRLNSYSMREGMVALELDIDQAVLSAIESLSEPGFLDDFKAELESKSVSYGYDVRLTENESSFDVIIAEYDIHGAELNDTTALDAFNNSFKESEVAFEALRGHGDENEEILRRYNREGNSKDQVAVIRVGVSEILETSTGRFLVHVETTALYYNSRSGEISNSDTSVKAVGYADSYEEAAKKAFEEAGRVLANVILIEF